MRTVLYSDLDMEPITVIDVPEYLMDKIRSHEVIRLPIMDSVETFFIDGKDPLKMLTRCVYITGERYIRKGQEHWILLTNDDELALLLKNTYLPGQLGDLAKQRKEAFIQGIIKTLDSIYGAKNS